MEGGGREVSETQTSSNPNDVNDGNLCFFFGGVIMFYFETELRLCHSFLKEVLRALGTFGFPVCQLDDHIAS